MTLYTVCNGAMMPCVPRVGQNFKIVYFIISLVLILMMHVFFVSQKST